MSLISPIRNRYLSAPCGCGSCRCETPFMVYESKSEEKMSSTTQRVVIEVGIEEQISRTDAILPAIAERAQQTERDRRPDRKSHTSELQSLMRISYAVFCMNKKHIQLSTDTNTANI